MKLVRTFLVAAAAALLVALDPTAAAAQEDVMRDAFGFHGSSLDVTVETESSGRIRLIRGRHSRIEVAGRAPNGFTSAALGGNGVRRLTLTALGADHADFIVVVPENVRVRVNWPGADRSELFGTLAESATYAWNTPDHRPAFETFGPRAGAAAPTAGTSVPRVLDVRRAHALDRLTLRLGEPAFGIAGGSTEARGGAGVLYMNAPTRGDIGVDLPRGQRFTLRLDGVDAVVIDGDDVRILCESVLTQRFPDGRRWLTLTPTERGCAGEAPRPAPPGAIPAARRT